MARPIQSTQHSHRVVAHQGVNAHQGEVPLNSLSDQQSIKRVFMRHGQFIQASDMRPLHGQEQPTFLIHNPAMNLRQKKAGATQGIRNSSARGASKSAWVCILPIRPPGCRGAETDRAAESCIAASSAPTSLRWSGDRRSSCCCRDGLIEVMRKPVGADGHSSWVEPAFPQEVR